MIVIALGANLESARFGPPRRGLEAALRHLEAAGIATTRRSGWYRSAPFPAADQPFYVNGVAEVESALSPIAMMAAMLEIETAFGGTVTASVNDSGQVTVTDDTGGTSELTVALQTNNEGGGSLTFGTLSATIEGENSRSREAAGQDAVLRVNGLTLTRSTNTVTDALEGVTLSLNDAEVGTTVTVSVDRDLTAVRGSIESFVADYNNALSLISAQFIMVWGFWTGVQGGSADRIRGPIQEADHEEELYGAVQSEGRVGGCEGRAESLGAGLQV